MYGAILESRNGTLVPLHIGIDRIEALEALQGSKYVQSDLADVFSAIKRQLHEGRYVLFSGTPCQVDALRSYLGNKAYESLLLIDIICHGVPSARMFQDYIRMLEKKCKDVYKRQMFSRIPFTRQFFLFCSIKILRRSAAGILPAG